MKFVVKRVKPSDERPHGLSYSLTLHGPEGERLIGFDNAHPVASGGGRPRRATTKHDHKHGQGAPTPQEYHDAATLLRDFWQAVDAVLKQKGVTPLKTLRIGIASYEDMKARTMAIARGELKPAADEPKLWFTSFESLARLLSDKSRALLDLIIAREPRSIAELEALSGRAKSNLSRTLKNMERFGLVELLKGEGGAVRPHVSYGEIQLDLPMGQHRHQSLASPAPD